MEFLRHLLLFLHFIGLAALIGAFLAQIGKPTLQATPGMLHGALLQLITGIGLVGVLQADDVEIDHTKVGVKFLVLAVILVLIITNRAKEKITTGVWLAIGLLSILNVGLAVFWT